MFFLAIDRFPFYVTRFLLFFLNLKCWKRLLKHFLGVLPILQASVAYPVTVKYSDR